MQTLTDGPAENGGEELSDTASRVRESVSTLNHLFLTLGLFLVIIASFTVGAKYAIVVFLGAPIFLGMMRAGDEGRGFIFTVLCMSFVIGQRTLYLGTYCRIHPSEIVIWLLAILCIPVSRPSFPLKAGIPFLVGALAFGTLSGFVPRGVFPQTFGLDVAYSKGLWLAVPAFFVCSKVLRRSKQVEEVGYLLSLESLFLSFLSIAEAYDLPFVRRLSAFYGEKTVIVDFAGFTRSASGFWGNLMLSALISLWLPWQIARWSRPGTSLLRRWIIGASILLSFMCIYYSGYRGIWAGTLAGMAFFSYLRGMRKVFFFSLLLAVGVYFLPQSATRRLSGIQESSRDTSSVKHLMRPYFAAQVLMKRPMLGSGWGASGLVHSDFLQFWADCGLHAVLAYLGVFILVLRRLLSTAEKLRSIQDRHSLYALAAGIVSYFLILQVETSFDLPEQYPPFWITMGLAYHYPNVLLAEQQQREGSATQEAAPR
jgi:hypothetical protein